MSIKDTLAVFGYGAKEAVNKRATYPYPDKPLPIQKRSRGMLSLDLENCIGCELCFRICPSDAIRMQKVDFKAAGFHTNARSEAPEIDFNKCIFCGLCSEICPPKVLHHTHKYDISTDDRKELVYSPFELKEVFEELVKPFEEDYDIIKFQKAGGQPNKTPQKPPATKSNSPENKTVENKQNMINTVRNSDSDKVNETTGKDTKQKPVKTNKQ